MKRFALFGLLLLTLTLMLAPAPTASASSGLTAAAESSYWCPWYSRYCSRDIDCRGYCGAGVPPEWEVCEFGCCACLG